MVRVRWYFAILLFLIVLLTKSVAASAAPQHFVKPIDGSIIDAFRAPTHQYGAGNRGWEYAVARGTPVRATSAGTVTYVGSINHNIIIVIEHEGYLRTTYLGVEAVTVKVGDHVEIGQTMAVTSGGRAYFGARCGDVYIDPQRLFDIGATLVSLDDERTSATTSTPICTPVIRPVLLSATPAQSATIIENPRVQMAHTGRPRAESAKATPQDFPEIAVGVLGAVVMAFVSRTRRIE